MHTDQSGYLGSMLVVKQVAMQLCLHALMLESSVAGSGSVTVHEHQKQSRHRVWSQAPLSVCKLPTWQGVTRVHLCAGQDISPRGWGQFWGSPLNEDLQVASTQTSMF
jgi:hypothetical protein